MKYSLLTICRGNGISKDQTRRQGCPLSPNIFSIFVERAIIKIESDKRCFKFNEEVLQFIRFADDIVTLPENPQQLQELS